MQKYFTYQHDHIATKYHQANDRERKRYVCVPSFVSQDTNIVVDMLSAQET